LNGHGVELEVLVEVGGHESSRYLVGSKPSVGCLRDRLARGVRSCRDGPPSHLVLTSSVVITMSGDALGHAFSRCTVARKRGNVRSSAVDVDLLKRPSLVGNGDVGTQLTERKFAIASARSIWDGVDDAHEPRVGSPAVLRLAGVEHRKVLLVAEEARGEHPDQVTDCWGNVVLVEGEVEVALYGRVGIRRSSKHFFSFSKDRLVQRASFVASFCIGARAGAGVDVWREQGTWSSSKPCEERDAAGHAVVRDIVGVGAAREDSRPRDVGVSRCRDGVGEVSETSFGWVASGVVGRGDNLVEPEKSSNFRERFAGEVWASVSEETFHGTKNEDPAIKESLSCFSRGEGRHGEQHGEPAKKASHNQDAGVAVCHRPWAGDVGSDDVVVSGGTNLLQRTVVAKGVLAPAADAVAGSDKAVHIGTLCGPPADAGEGMKRLRGAEVTANMGAMSEVEESRAKIRRYHGHVGRDRRA